MKLRSPSNDSVTAGAEPGAAEHAKVVDETHEVVRHAVSPSCTAGLALEPPKSRPARATGENPLAAPLEEAKLTEGAGGNIRGSVGDGFYPTTMQAGHRRT